MVYLILFGLLVLASLVFVFPKWGSFLAWPILFTYPHYWWSRHQFLPLNIGMDDLFCLGLFFLIVFRRNFMEGLRVRFGYALWIITAFVLITAISTGVGALDPRGMETVLTNLVSNGIDAVMMREEPGGSVILRTREEDGDLIFEVEDNGCGMDWEVKGKIFTTFFTTKGGQGTGLGLLTTRKIVQEHGGRIDVESVAGQGTTFRIRLPRKRLEALAAASTSANGSNNEAKL